MYMTKFYSLSKAQTKETIHKTASHMVVIIMVKKEYLDGD